MRSRPTAQLKPRWTFPYEFFHVDRIIGTLPNRLWKRGITAMTADIAEHCFAPTLPGMSLRSVEESLLRDDGSEDGSVFPVAFASAARPYTNASPLAKIGGVE